VTDSEGFIALRASWTALWSRLDRPHVFSSFDWCWSAWSLVARPRGCRLRLLCGRLDGRLVLIWPMMEDGNVLRMLSSETLEYRDVLVESSAHATRWVEDAWTHVTGATRATTYLFQNLRLPSVLSTRLAEVPRARQFGGGWCPLVSLERFRDWDAYAKTLPKSLMSDQRRQWKRLRAAHPGVAFRVVDAAESIEPVMDWICRHKIAWSQSRGTRVWFNAADIFAMLKAVARAALPDGRLVLATLSDGDATMSAGWGYACGSEFLFHAFAYDEAYATYSPSRLFQEGLLRHCFDRGFRTFDFMPGQEAYKRVWATEYVRQESYLGTFNWRGALLLQLSATKASDAPPALHRAYRALPRPWRNVLYRGLRSYRLVNRALNLKPIPKPDAAPCSTAALLDVVREERRIASKPTTVSGERAGSRETASIDATRTPSGESLSASS